MTKIPYRLEEIQTQLFRTIDAKVNTVATIDTNVNTVNTKVDKIDGASVNGLSGVNNSLAYKVEEIEKHFHNTQKVYGYNSGFITEDAPVKIDVIGGNNAWGSELHIYNGDTIEAGSTTKQMDIGKMYIVSVSTANKISVVEFLSGTVGNVITGTQVQATAVFTRVAGDPMVADNDKVILTALTGSSGINTYTTYYVVNTAGSTFKLALTQGGTAITLTGTDGTFGIKKITATTLSKVFVSKTAVNSDAVAEVFPCPRVTCDKHLFVRAKSESGSTITVGFLLGIHTYSA